MSYYDKLEARILQLEFERDDLREDVKVLKAANADLAQGIELAKSRIELLRQERDDLRERVAALEAALGHARRGFDQEYERAFHLNHTAIQYSEALQAILAAFDTADLPTNVGALHDALEDARRVLTGDVTADDDAHLYGGGLAPLSARDDGTNTGA